MTDRTAIAPEAWPEQWVELGGVRVRYVEHQGVAEGGESADAPTFLLVHGLGGALTNWDSLAPLLTTYGRVISLDLAGFGMTEATPQQATVDSNRRLIAAFIRALELPPVVLVGNSMGGMLVALQAASEPDTVAAVVLVDPALPGHPLHLPHPMVLVAFGLYLVPPLGRRFLASRNAKLSPEQLATESFALVVSHMSPVPQWLLDRHIELVRRRLSVMGEDAAQTFLAAAKSVVVTSMRRPSYRRSLAAIRRPVLLIHGDRDKLVSVKAARAAARAHPEWTYAEGMDRGHCPMFEDPTWVRDQIVAFLGARALASQA